MVLNVEFLGLARSLAQTKESLVNLDDQASFRDLLCHLASQFPALYGPVIELETFSLSPAFMLNVDGRRVVKDLDAPAEDGQRILFMFMEAGG